MLGLVYVANLHPVLRDGYSALPNQVALKLHLSATPVTLGRRRISLKLQHWLVTMKYLPGRDNGFSDALSRKERARVTRVTPAIQETDVS